MYLWQNLVSRLTNNDLRVTEQKLQRHDLTRFLHYFCLLKELDSNVKLVHFTMGSHLLWYWTIYDIYIPFSSSNNKFYESQISKMMKNQCIVLAIFLIFVYFFYSRLVQIPLPWLLENCHKTRAFCLPLLKMLDLTALPMWLVVKKMMSPLFWRQWVWTLTKRLYKIKRDKIP